MAFPVCVEAMRIPSPPPPPPALPHPPPAPPSTCVRACPRSPASRPSSCSSMVPVQPSGFCPPCKNHTAAEWDKTYWTNDKHISYLNSIEATFVKKMYDREFCAVDLCGQAPQHEINSANLEYDESESTEFAQQALDNANKEIDIDSRCTTSTAPILSQSSSSSNHVFSSPWVKHFMSRANNKTDIGNTASMKMGFLQHFNCKAGKTRHHLSSENIVNDSLGKHSLKRMLTIKGRLLKEQCKFSEYEKHISTGVHTLCCAKGISKRLKMDCDMNIKYADNCEFSVNKPAGQSSKQSEVLDPMKVDRTSKMLKLSREDIFAVGKSLKITSDYFQYEAGSECSALSDDALSEISSTGSSVSEISYFGKVPTREKGFCC